MRASYREAIAFIAANDEAGNPGALDVEEVATLLTVALVADLWRKDEETVAADVVRYRERPRVAR